MAMNVSSRLRRSAVARTVDAEEDCGNARSRTPQAGKSPSRNGEDVFRKVPGRYGRSRRCGDRSGLAFGLAALIHAGLLLIPLPRAADNPARPEIEPAAIAVELVAPATSPDTTRADIPGSAMTPAAPPRAAAARSVQTTQSARKPRGTRNDDHRAQRVAMARSEAPRAMPRRVIVVAPAGPHVDDANTDGLQAMTLDMGGDATVAALDELSGRLAAGPDTGQPGLARVDRQAYALRVRGLVAAHRRYPARARRRGQEGEVSIRLRIAPDGRLLGQPRVTASSGADALDREALRMVRQASPFPPSGAATAIDIAVPVRFSLDER